MKFDRIEQISTRSSQLFYVPAASVLVCVWTYLFFAQRPLIPDIAWIIEASRRWIAGGRLYVDMIDVNPPLIFYETVALSAGQLTQHAYIAGVCIVMGLSALWVFRMRGAYLAISTLAAMLLGGLTDFGQRDHLALIFVVPFLLGQRAARAERIALGAWAFFGVGLKPYLLFIPVSAVLGRCALARSFRPLVSAEFVALGVACLVYVGWVAAIHPVYLTDIVPLGQLVYGAYGADVKPLFAGLSIAIAIAALIPIVLRDRDRIPLAVATLGALASFYLQGRNWSYHFVPAIGLAILLSLWLAHYFRPVAVIAIILAGGQLLRGAHPVLPPSPIPDEANSVAFMTAHVWPAYPTALDCGVRNETRYPALWVLPGAWNILNDPTTVPVQKERAQRILDREREIIRGDLLARRPQMVFADARLDKPYFDYPFNYQRFLGELPGYRYAGRVSQYDVWVLPGITLHGRPCSKAGS